MSSLGCLRFAAILAAIIHFPLVAGAVDPTHPDSKMDPSAQILISKGILTSSDAAALRQIADQRAGLLTLLRNKEILTALDYDTLTAPPASAQVSGALVASTTPMVPTSVVPAPEIVNPETP